MKKSAVSLFVVICACVLFWGCSSKNEIAEYKNKMTAAQNCQISITMDVPVFGTIKLTEKVDGNLSYRSETILTEEEYEEKVGENVYTYKKGEDGKWTKILKDKEEKNDDSFDVDKIFDPDQYEKVKEEKHTYRQKKSSTIDGFDSLVITIEKDTCLINGNITMEGLVYKVTIQISNLGKIKLTLPQIEEKTTE